MKKSFRLSVNVCAPNFEEDEENKLDGMLSSMFFSLMEGSFPFDPWDRSIDFDSALGPVKSYVSACDVQNWFDVLKDHTFPTEWFALDDMQTHAIRARFSKQPLTKQGEKQLVVLQGIIDSLITKLGGAAFVRLSTRSPKDAIVSSPEFIRYMQECTNSIDPDNLAALGFAFYDCVMKAGRITSGKAAVDLLCNSSRVFMDLRRAADAKFQVLCVVRGYSYLAPSSEFRVFVVQGKITAVSQYIDCLFFPQLDPLQLRNVLIQFEEQGKRDVVCA